MSARPTPPDWLKNDPFVHHDPSGVIFAPDRRFVWQYGEWCLVDANENAYPFAECGPVRAGLIRTAILITDTGAELFVVYDRALRQFVVSDGRSRAAVRLDAPNPTPPEPGPDDEPAPAPPIAEDPAARAAAASIALAFGGAIVKDPEAALEAIGYDALMNQPNNQTYANHYRAA